VPPKKWTESKDRADDKRKGIKEGSPKDVKLDRARGLPPDVVKKGKAMGAGHGSGTPAMPSAPRPVRGTLLGSGNARKKR
jgi:hypothetical protein